jgi:hypothetical protein
VHRGPSSANASRVAVSAACRGTGTPSFIDNLARDRGDATAVLDGVHARTTICAGGMGPTVRVVARDASADAYLGELWVDAVAR